MRPTLLFCVQAGAGNRDDGIQNNVIRNNTLWDCGFGGLIVRGNGSGNVLVNNLIQSLSGSNLGRQFALEDFNLIGSGSRAGAHDLSGRPRFVDAAGADYHLAAGSPGIDAGTSDGVSATDADGPAASTILGSHRAAAPGRSDLGASRQRRPRVHQARKLPAGTHRGLRCAAPLPARRDVEFRLSTRGRALQAGQARNDWIHGWLPQAAAGHNRVRVTLGALGSVASPRPLPVYGAASTPAAACRTRHRPLPVGARSSPGSLALPASRRHRPGPARVGRAGLLAPRRGTMTHVEVPPRGLQLEPAGTAVGRSSVRRLGVQTTRSWEGSQCWAVPDQPAWVPLVDSTRTDARTADREIVSLEAPREVGAPAQKRLPSTSPSASIFAARSRAVGPPAISSWWP